MSATFREGSRGNSQKLDFRASLCKIMKLSLLADKSLEILGSSGGAFVRPRKTGIAVLACGLAWLTAGLAHAQTLQQTVETAIKTHPRVLAADAQRRAVQQDLAQARGGYWPTLDVN